MEERIQAVVKDVLKASEVTMASNTRGGGDPGRSVCSRHGKPGCRVRIIAIMACNCKFLLCLVNYFFVNCIMFIGIKKYFFLNKTCDIDAYFVMQYLIQAAL